MTSNDNFIFVDIETTGLPLDRNAPIADLDNWPRLVRIAWLVHDHDRRVFSTRDMVVKPDRYLIPPSATKIHGITTEIANKIGVPLERVLTVFIADCVKSSYLIAHNIDFDTKIIAAEIMRTGIDVSQDARTTKICTMQSSIDYCAIPRRYTDGRDRGGYKYPKLDELYHKLFGKNREETAKHDALSDVRVCAECFWKLVDLGVITY